MGLEKRAWLCILVAGLAQSCLNKNVEDFNNSKFLELVARAGHEAGTWTGVLEGEGGERLAGAIVQVRPRPQGTRDVVMAGEVTLYPAEGKPLRLGFQTGIFDAPNRALRVSIPVTRLEGGSANVEFQAAFRDDTLTGAIWSGAFAERYKGSLSLRREGALPERSTLVTGRTAAGPLLPELSRYGATIPNPNVWDTEHPTEKMILELRSNPSSEQRFLAYFEPVLHTEPMIIVNPGPTNAQGRFRPVSLDWRESPRRFLTQTSGVPATCNLECVESTGRGWDCVLGCPGREKLVVGFLPEP